jgi:hypothetical protein
MGKIRILDGEKMPIPIRNTVGNCTYPADFAELVLGLLGRDAVHDESAFHVVDDAKVLARLLNLNDVHESGGEAGVSPHVAVNLHQALLHNRLHLLHGQGVLQPIPEGDKIDFRESVTYVQKSSTPFWNGSEIRESIPRTFIRFPILFSGFHFQDTKKQLICCWHFGSH